MIQFLRNFLRAFFRTPSAPKVVDYTENYRQIVEDAKYSGKMVMVTYSRFSQVVRVFGVIVYADGGSMEVENASGQVHRMQHYEVDAIDGFTFS